jgi:hypothetical protein
VRGAVPQLRKTSSWRGAQLKDRENFTFYLTFTHVGLSSGLFPSGFQTKILYAILVSFVLATCHIHLTVFHFIVVFCEE